MNYSLGKIYKIEPVGDHPEGDMYIGSTCQPNLSQRLAKHRSTYKDWKLGKTNKTASYTLFDKYGFENTQIILIESVNCNTKDELSMREAYHIRSNLCVNKNIPLRTHKEYVIANRTIILDKHKAYHIQNKDNIHARQKLYREANRVECLCGGSYDNSNSHKNRHLNSTKHIDYIEAQNIISE
jgi:hypothetical protein